MAAETPTTQLSQLVPARRVLPEAFLVEPTASGCLAIPADFMGIAPFDVTVPIVATDIHI